MRIEVGRFEPRTVTPGATGHRHRHADQHRRRADHRPRRPAAAGRRAHQPRRAGRRRRGPRPGHRRRAAPSSRCPASSPPADDAGLHLHRGLRRAAPGPRRRLSRCCSTSTARSTATTSAASASCPPTSSSSPLLPAARTAVAWLWPLVERTHRSASGGFADDELAESIAEDGPARPGAGRHRAAARHRRRGARSRSRPPGHPRRSTPPSSRSSQLMAAGPYEVGEGEHRARAPTPRRRSSSGCAPSPPSTPSWRCPTATWTPTRCDAAGLADVLTRSLPGTPAGTAQDPPGPRSTPRRGTTAHRRRHRDDAPGRGRPHRRTAPGPAILADALDVEPRTDLAWAAGGIAARPTRWRRCSRGRRRARSCSAPDALTTGDAAVGLQDHHRRRPVDRRDRRTGPAGRAGRRLPTLGERRRRAPSRPQGGPAHGRAALPRRARRPHRAGPAGYGADRAGRRRPATSTPGPRAPAR